jgi:hypothetical protein
VSAHDRGFAVFRGTYALSFAHMAEDSFSVVYGDLNNIKLLLWTSLIMTYQENIRFTKYNIYNIELMNSKEIKCITFFQKEV